MFAVKGLTGFSLAVGPSSLILNVINPKAYAAVLVIHVEFLLPHESTALAWFMTSLVCWVLVVVIDLIWLLLGQVLQPLMTEPTRARRIRWSFAMAMVIAVWWAPPASNHDSAEE